MPRKNSSVHKQSGYWMVKFDAPDGWEEPHIHVLQGDRELKMFILNFEIKKQRGMFSRNEIDEIKLIAASYREEYRLSVDSKDLTNTSKISYLNKLKQILLLSKEEEKSYVK